MPRSANPREIRDPCCSNWPYKGLSRYLLCGLIDLTERNCPAVIRTRSSRFRQPVAGGLLGAFVLCAGSALAALSAAAGLATTPPSPPSGASIGGQSTPAPAAALSGDTPITDEATPLVLADFPSYLKEVEKIRGLTFTGPVAKGRQSLDEFRGFIGREIDREMPPAIAECTTRSLRLLGLLPEEVDLRKAYSEILLSQVAAYYNPESKTFYVVRADLPAETMRPTVVHELAHALQDQRFGLEARMEALRKSGNEDEENAFRFLAEGEATYVMTLGALRDLSIDPEANKASVDTAVEATALLGREAIAAQIEALAGTLDAESLASMKAVLSYPDYLFRLLLDPYYVGQSVVHRAYRRGGWAAVNALWKNPPLSTELFLHPEKLDSGKRDEPVKVTVPDLSAALGPGYAPACENTLGEMETEVLLEAALPEPSDRIARARRAAGGWGGDRYRAFEKEGNGTVVVWKTVWDTEQDADQFGEAITLACSARMPKNAPALFPAPASPTAPPPPSSHVSPPGSTPPSDSGSDAPARALVSSFSSRDSATLWRAPGAPPAQALLLVHCGHEVTFVAGASATQAQALLAVLHPALAPTPPPASRPSPTTTPPPASRPASTQ